MSLDRRLSRLEQDIGEALDAAGTNAYERLSPEESAMWEEMITAMGRAYGLPHDPNGVRAGVDHGVAELERRGLWFSLAELRRLRDAYQG